MSSWRQLLILIACCAASKGSYYSDQYEVTAKRIADFVRKSGLRQLTWKHGKNAYFENMTEDEIKSRVHGLLIEGVNFTQSTNSRELKNTHDAATKASEIPYTFDAREKWPKCKYIGLVKDQATCGSCWAVSSASVMSDRICIAHEQKIQPFLSEEDIMTCCTQCGYGCKGGSPLLAFRYWTTDGVPTGGLYGSDMGCKPYSIMPGKKTMAVTPPCAASCTRKHYRAIENDRYYGKRYFICNGVTAMQKEIMTNGPIVATFAVYSEFIYYKGGVYMRSSNDHIIGYHAVKVIGWGVDNQQIPYWLAVNSWNTTFGEDGLFKIVRGKNECGFESMLPIAAYAT